MFDIYIYGIIDQNNNSMLSLQRQLAQVPKGINEIKIHIRSEGGDVAEGLGMYDILRASEKKIITVAEGIVASIASIIFLAGDQREIMENANIIIHNPWVKGDGDATELEFQAGRLRTIEQRMANIYSERTGYDQASIADLMSKETYINAESAIKMNFATTITQPFKAVAYLTQNNLKMTEIEKSVNEKLDGFWAKMSKAMGFDKPKGLTVTTANGAILDFGESVMELADIAVGKSATVDGQPANGEYVSVEGKKFVFESGVLMSIEEVETEVDQLKKENEQLKAENAEFKTKNEGFEASLTKLKEEFTEVRAQIKTDIEGFEKKQKPGEAKGKENRMEGFTL